jgi:NAD(P)-dependent dehydrogenase (short-subunit alcohol dehydrogenase family)
VSRAQVALAWVLAKPFVTSPIVGATKQHHIDDAVAAVDLDADRRRDHPPRGALHPAPGRRLPLTGKAGRTLGRSGPFDLDDFRAVIDLNLIGTFNTNRLCAAHMAENEPNDDGERGVMINTASIAAFEGQIGQVAYTAAKAGIAGMTLTMARDLGSLGIRVMTIAPSLFATGLTAGVTEERAANLTKDAAFPKRLGRPDEYGRLAIAIIENPMLNGDTIRLDAGTRFAPK